MKTLAWLTTVLGAMFLLSGCANTKSHLYTGTFNGSVQGSKASRVLPLDSIQLQLVHFPEAQHKRWLRFVVEKGGETNRMIVKSRFPAVQLSGDGRFVFKVSSLPVGWYVIAAQSEKMKFPMFLGDPEHRLKLVRLDATMDRASPVELGDLVFLSPFERATFDLKVGDEFPISFERVAVQ